LHAARSRREAAEGCARARPRLPPPPSTSPTHVPVNHLHPPPLRRLALSALRPPSDHPQTTLRPPSDHPQTTLRPPSDHPQTTLNHPHPETTLRPPSDHPQTTLRPPSDHPQTTLTTSPTWLVHTLARDGELLAALKARHRPRPSLSLSLSLSQCARRVERVPRTEPRVRGPPPCPRAARCRLPHRIGGRRRPRGGGASRAGTPAASPACAAAHAPPPAHTPPSTGLAGVR
jgi:hypothetical protein